MDTKQTRTIFDDIDIGAAALPKVELLIDFDTAWNIVSSKYDSARFQDMINTRGNLRWIISARIVDMLFRNVKSCILQNDYSTGEHRIYLFGILVEVDYRNTNRIDLYKEII